MGGGTTLKVVKRRRANVMDTFSIVVKIGTIYGWSGLLPLIRGFGLKIDERNSNKGDCRSRTPHQRRLRHGGCWLDGGD